MGLATVPRPSPAASLYTEPGGCPLAKEDKEAESDRKAELRTTWEGKSKEGH